MLYCALRDLGCISKMCFEYFEYVLLSCCCFCFVSCRVNNYSKLLFLFSAKQTRTMNCLSCRKPTTSAPVFIFCCGHGGHRACIRALFYDAKFNCPVCRRPITAASVWQFGLTSNERDDPTKLTWHWRRRKIWVIDDRTKMTVTHKYPRGMQV